MKRLALLLCIFAFSKAVENKDRIKLQEKRDANSVQIIPQKKYDVMKYSPTQRPQNKRDTIRLIDEDFEAGMPADWTVIDGNNDGHTWTTGTTFDLLYVHPPNYGTAYAYYSDDDAGGAAPAGNEYLISPAVSCAGATIITLSHSWGHNLMGLYIYGTTQVRLHDGISWDAWSTLATYPYTANGVDTFHLDSYLPAESVQVQFTYEDPLGEWSFAFGIDNVLLEAEMPSFYVWDFETGWQGWTHTNGYAFPDAWDVMSATFHGPIWQLPGSGDSTMWIDADAAGGITSDSALSPVVVPPWNLHWLVYGYCNNGGSGSYVNDLYVGIKYLLGSVWNIAELTHYPGGAISGPAWDSLDVSAYASSDSIQVYVYFSDNNTWGYWAAFDNVGLYAPLEHDVGCTQVVSPPEGSAVPLDYDVIGRIQNIGNNAETFDAMAVVYDTVGMTQVFSQSVTLTDFPVAGDSNVNFGTVTFAADSYYYTEIYTMLTGDSDPSNDTSAVHSTTAIWWYDIIFEMDAQAVCNDNQLCGIEFDGTYFYITGGNNAMDPNKVYVVDTAGNLVWSLDQPSHSTGWGWKYFWWDHAFSGPGGLGYLYARYGGNVDQFSIDLQGGFLIYHGFYPLPSFLPYVTSVVYMPDSQWYFSPSPDSVYKWKWTEVLQVVPNPGYYIRDGTYDGDTVDGPWIWWHSQDDPGTGHLCQISQMDPYSMAFTNLVFGYPLPSPLIDGIAGGLCFYSGFRGTMDVLFALVQGTPHDFIVGIFVRPYQGPGVGDKVDFVPPLGTGFAPHLATIAKTRAPVAYTTTKPGHVSLKIYDVSGRLVRKLFEGFEQAGQKTIHWDGKNENQCRVANGCYFIKLEAGDNIDVHKIILLK